MVWKISLGTRKTEKMIARDAIGRPFDLFEFRVVFYVRSLVDKMYSSVRHLSVKAVIEHELTVFRSAFSISSISRWTSNVS